jgi:hypothetical protein
MALDPEFQKKLQIFLLIAIVLVGARTGYIVYTRHEAAREETKPKQETAMNPDYYVTPKQLHAYDLKDAQELTQQPVWVKYGYQLTYFPYDAARRKTDFKHDLGTLPPLEKLEVKNVVEEAAPEAPGVKQVLAIFSLQGKACATVIGSDQGGDFKLRAPDIFFLQDPHELYKHWPAEVWQKIDAHEVQKGMSELQASFAIGIGSPEGSGSSYGSRTLDYPNGGREMVIRFEDDKAVDIKTGPQDAGS